MIKSLQKIGNSKGIVIDKSILRLLNASDNTKFEIELKGRDIVIRPISTEMAYSSIAKKHRKSLDKLAK